MKSTGPLPVKSEGDAPCILMLLEVFKCGSKVTPCPAVIANYYALALFDSYPCINVLIFPLSDSARCFICLWKFYRISVATPPAAKSLLPSPPLLISWMAPSCDSREN